MRIASSTTSPFNQDHPFPARIIENRPLSKPGSAKEVRHYAVDLAGSGLTYRVGDRLGVYPTNRREDVDALVRRLGATGDERVVLPRSQEQLSLRTALTHRLALTGPTRGIVETLAARTGDPAEKRRLEELLQPGAPERLAAHLEQSEFADLLAECPAAHLSPQELVNHLRKLIPRLYSIASSPRRFPHEAHLTVTTVRYVTNGRERHGVCSTFLAERSVVNETTVPVFVAAAHFDLPDDGARDLILVGPGTGVAPFRAFLQERAATGAAGRAWLFFGGAHRATDYLYEEEWTGFQRQGVLTRIDLAWSRDQAGKIYVQDRLIEAQAEIWRWLERGACLYVCGDAQRMAKGVDAALHCIVAEQGGLEPLAAADYVKRLKRDRRYQRDVY